MVPALLLALSLAMPRADSVTAAAEAALRAGEAWRATRIIAPLLDQPATRTPEVLLLAARAAAGWDGWATVSRLLANQTWLDREQDGLGRALLARAAVERGDPTALTWARQAIEAAPNAGDRPTRLVTLARALDRANRYDSAATVYRDAAAALPAIADWLHLRAAGVIRDSAARASLYAGLSNPAAQARIRWTEALARDRTGDRAGAARIYASLGATLAALRLRLATAGSDSARRGVRRDLVAWLGDRPPAGEVTDGIALLDRNFVALTAAEELVVARRASAAGQLDRAHRGFTRAGRSARLSDGDRLAHGTVLARLGRHAEAITRFDAVREPARRAEARYQRARSRFRLGQEDRAINDLRTVRDSFPGTAAGATAGWLLGDTFVDRDDDASAREEWLETARRYPRSSQGDRAAFQAALVAWVQGDHSAAATEFDHLADRSGPENTAALYWSGRAWAALGDSARARQRWQSLVLQHPQSYYVVPAARRLEVPPFRDTTGVQPPGRPAAQPPLERAALLDSLGMDVESRFELERFGSDAQGPDPAPPAWALLAAGHPSRALQLAMRAVAQGTASTTLMPFLYPVIDLEILEREAVAVGLDPFLVAGLIRQESLYDPRARSRADARGLMQVLPSVGAAAARSEGYPEWDTVLLYQPDVNMHIGLRHLAERWAKCGGNLEAALAAYNAGSTPVNQWLARTGTADREVFIERIPYIETRDYVRRVLYNQARYQAIYGRERAGEDGKERD
ncbi:MAG TPA: transglycosylase SLT domain-containing protein [Gemmatimonadales bacterium]